jgi:hypothetical protein
MQISTGALFNPNHVSIDQGIYEAMRGRFVEARTPTDLGQA